MHNRSFVMLVKDALQIKKGRLHQPQAAHMKNGIYNSNHNS